MYAYYDRLQLVNMINKIVKISDVITYSTDASIYEKYC